MCLIIRYHSTQLKNVVVLTNFDVTAQNVTPSFPYDGVWYDLMDTTGDNFNYNNIEYFNTPKPDAAVSLRYFGNKNV